MPLSSPHNIPAMMMISPDSKRQGSQSLPPNKKSASIHTAQGTTEVNKSTISDTINSKDNNIVTVDEPSEVDSNVISADGLSKGCRINDFVFLDQSIEARRLYRDCSYLHSFKVRGPHYLSDKKKVSIYPLPVAVRKPSE
mmetsp:Transcript_4835/g.6751  ORF Transcript_4835/g.6751 Transcript_4835/m.6751 type:complete len:140 (-) Transcript_4835:1296-1715(-)